eukprot:3167230-Pyramimonas_sp.AAC.1
MAVRGVFRGAPWYCRIPQESRENPQEGCARLDRTAAVVARASAAVAVWVVVVMVMVVKVELAIVLAWIAMATILRMVAAVN